MKQSPKVYIPYQLLKQETRILIQLFLRKVSTPVIYQDPSTSTPSLVVQTQDGNMPTPAKPIISEGGIARVCKPTHLFPTIEEGTEEDNDGEESLMVPDQEI